MKHSRTFVVIAACFLMLIDPAFAAGGTTSITSFFTTINGILQTAAVTIVTCAIIWAGLKVLWMGAMIREIAGPFIGALIIGGASYFASLLLG